VNRWIGGSAGPAIVAGIVSALFVWWVWGAVNPLPVVSDEQSYLLQSRIFATGHWSAPSPPIPEFFEQSHVLTVPVVASKFPPGHALLLSLGALVGWPALIVLLLTAVTGALLFVLVRRVSNGWVATLTWLIWLSDPINLRFRASYFSEVTTQALWFVAWWTLLEWRQTRDRRWLLGLAVAIGWGAITRPLTMLAFAVPVGVIVIRDVVREKSWRDLAAATALGIAMLGVIPLWSAETTGDWRLTPLTLYQRDYLPYDKPGFGIDRTKPARPLNPVNAFTYTEFDREHAVHTIRNLPVIAWDRLRVIAIREWSGPRMVLVPFVLLGLFAMSAEVVFALVCSLALLVGYLSYGHFSEWTLYYFEATPMLAMLAGLGLGHGARAFGSGPGRGSGESSSPDARAPRPSPILSAASVALAVLALYEARIWRTGHIEGARWYTQFENILSRMPKNPAVIFVHYAPRLQPHPGIVRNSPNLAEDQVWIVNDLGARDPELMRLAGSRIPIAFYEDGNRFEVDRNLLGKR
jgi:hypothetical protein